MTKKLKILSRHQINTNAWDGCIAASSQRIVYGYSWYLDAVLTASEWKWMGIVLLDESGHYRAVMPVPLRRKAIAGITYEWVVHQSFFCQFLGIFTRDNTIDTEPFFRKMIEEFRYGSIYCTRQQPIERLSLDFVHSRTTHILNLAPSYEDIYQNYTQDRKVNLRRALAANWTIIESNDPEPLLTLFRENHAHTIEGGVADWAYDMLINLIFELKKRNLTLLRYAIREGKTEAGVLFVREGKRIIYLLNAASEIGRRENARTFLIDQIIQENAGQPILFDFESPEKPAIRNFYQSFGAVEEPFSILCWNRLSGIEQAVLSLKKRLMHR